MKWAFTPHRSSERVVALLAVLLVAGCASNVKRTPTGYRHARHHYAIGVPDGPGPAWRRIEIEGAWIAFRRPGPETISLQSRCGKPVARPAVMARNLVVGVGERELVQAGPVIVGGTNGWIQTFDTRSGDVTVRVTTVTAVIEGCTFDWTLATVGASPQATHAFEAWWGTFALDPLPPEQVTRK
jgi:hypothetical protein